MKIVKVTLNGGMVLFIPFEELNEFDVSEASIVGIQELEAVEMPEKDYNELPGLNINQRTFMKCH